MTGTIYVEIAIMAIVILYIMQYIGGVSVMKFVDDNSIYFQKLKLLKGGSKHWEK